MTDQKRLVLTIAATILSAFLAGTSFALSLFTVPPWTAALIFTLIVLCWACVFSARRCSVVARAMVREHVIRELDAAIEPETEPQQPPLPSDIDALAKDLIKHLRATAQAAADSLSKSHEFSQALSGHAIAWDKLSTELATERQEAAKVREIIGVASRPVAGRDSTADRFGARLRGRDVVPQGEQPPAFLRQPEEGNRT